ncbi:MAG: hypothetical protein ACFE8P_12700 [Promethearchaeota archaeon]
MLDRVISKYEIPMDEPGGPILAIHAEEKCRRCGVKLNKYVNAIESEGHHFCRSCFKNEVLERGTLLFNEVRETQYFFDNEELERAGWTQYQRLCASFEVAKEAWNAWRPYPGMKYLAWTSDLDTFYFYFK